MKKRKTSRKTERQLAAEIGVSPSLVHRKRAQGKSDKQITEEAARTMRKASEPDITFAEAQRRKEAALARLREIEVAREEGRVVAVEDAAEGWGRMVSAFRSRMIAIPSKLAPQLFGMSISEIQDRLKDEIWQGLTELSNYDPGPVNGTDDDEAR